MDIYELWYSFLKRAYDDPDIAVSKQVRTDFGDLSEPFREWWPEHKHLFERLDDNPLYVIKDAADYEYWACPDLPELDLVVSFNMYCSKAQLLEAFSNLLDERHLTKRGRPPKPKKMSEYAVETYQSLTALKRTLDVLDKRDKEPGWKLYEIGENLNLCLSSMPEKGDSKKDTSDKRRVMSATASRYLRWAKEIKENVAQGVFPQHSR